MGQLLLKPKHVYSTVSKIVENAGFKNVGDFYADPGEAAVPPPGPPPELALKQMELQADAQKFQATSAHEKDLEVLRAQAKLQETNGQLQLQAANDQRDAERELLIAQHKAEIERMQIDLDRYKTDADNNTRIQVALINQTGRAQAAQTAAAAREASANDRTADQQPGA
jgi:hypothetical protein